MTAWKPVTAASKSPAALMLSPMNCPTACTTWPATSTAASPICRSAPVATCCRAFQPWPPWAPTLVDAPITPAAACSAAVANWPEAVRHFPAASW